MKTLDDLRNALDEAHWKMELADIHGDRRAWLKWSAMYHELLAEYNEACVEVLDYE